MAAGDHLTPLLLQPERAPRLTLADWDIVVRQGRRAALLATLATRLDDRHLLKTVPERPRRHLQAAMAIAHRHAAAVAWEAGEIGRALAFGDVPFVLLKGAAYVAAHLPPAAGRLFSDIDILVEKGRLADAEQALLVHGWVTTHHDPYDQRYYRQWMHELPPLRHVRRQTVLDLHHALLPETARLHPDPAKVWAAAVAVEGGAGLRVLCPADMVLHSATHLFFDGELDHGLRDLVDLDALLRHFGNDPAFWPRLLDRADELGLGRPLHYALRYTTQRLATPVAAAVVRSAARAAPTPLAAPLMDALFSRALAPDHPTCATPLTPLARFLLYLRAHYLRMPLHLLLPHLLRKAWMRRHPERPPARPLNGELREE